MQTTITVCHISHKNNDEQRIEKHQNTAGITLVNQAWNNLSCSLEIYIFWGNVSGDREEVDVLSVGTASLELGSNHPSGYILS